MIIRSQLTSAGSPLRDVVNSSPSEGHFSTSLITTQEAQRYKQQFQLLETQYEALLQTKEKISKKFREQLVRWKKFKHWSAKEEMKSGRKMNIRRRFSRGKVMEEVGPRIVTQDVPLSDNIIPAQDEGVVTKPLNDISVHDDHRTTDQPAHHTASTPPCSPLKSEPKDTLGLPPISHCVEESLTQPSSVPTFTQPAISPHVPGTRSLTIHKDPYEYGSAIPLSQQSLTQSSSMASPSPVRAPKDMLHALTKEVSQPKVFAIDSPPR
jgi:hypothetical protein